MTSTLNGTALETPTCPVLVKPGAGPDARVPEVAELSLVIHLAHRVLVVGQLHHRLQELLAAPRKQLRLR